MKERFMKLLTAKGTEMEVWKILALLLLVINLVPPQDLAIFNITILGAQNPQAAYLATVEPIFKASSVTIGTIYYNAMMESFFFGQQNSSPGFIHSIWAALTVYWIIIGYLVFRLILNIWTAYLNTRKEAKTKL